eukprot:6188333-Pleurochrysis_carterae.AAC.9
MTRMSAPAQYHRSMRSEQVYVHTSVRSHLESAAQRAPLRPLADRKAAQRTLLHGVHRIRMAVEKEMSTERSERVQICEFENSECSTELCVRKSVLQADGNTVPTATARRIYDQHDNSGIISDKYD